MSWNEWKSARTSRLRRFFYLYLVGNLRSDLTDALPFLRIVRDPFETLWAEELEESSKTRKVRLDLDSFADAEELQLGVRQDMSSPQEQDQNAPPVSTSDEVADGQAPVA